MDRWVMDEEIKGQVDGWMMTQTQVGKQPFIYNLHAYILKYIYNFPF